MKGFLAIIICIMFLFSCGNKENENDELQAEYDLIKSRKPSDSTIDKPQNDIQSPLYTLGEDYERLAQPYDTQNAKKVVVYEFFGYPCPHCFHFEPFMEKLLEGKPDYVELIRVPLNFQKGWDILQQAYLTAESMGIVEQSHTKMFEAIHNEHKRFKSIDQVADWYAQEVGINKGEFLSTANSFILDSKQRNANNMGQKMQITSTPALVINGTYKPSKKIRNRDEIIRVTKYLIDQEAKAMGLLPE